jgi:N-acetylglucosaminyldiphosphoundecaprenol N-acetyl-beta-D-mannosaminyltransferase
MAARGGAAGSREKTTLKVDICGIPVDRVTMDCAVQKIGRLVARGRPSLVVTPNVDHIVRLQTDREFLRAYQAADLVLADGMPLLWAARFLGTTLPERVTGSDLFPAVCREAARAGHTVFLLGGRPGAASETAARIRRAFKGIRFCGTYCPPFGFELDSAENKKCIRMIRNAAPDILFVALGTPKQEKWMNAHFHELHVPVCVGVGATFDFIAGMVRRAPRWMQAHGLEWLWRLMEEPLRLWRRYLVDDMRFFRLVLRQRLNRLPPPCSTARTGGGWAR